MCLSLCVYVCVRERESETERENNKCTCAQVGLGWERAGEGGGGVLFVRIIVYTCYSSSDIYDQYKAPNFRILFTKLWNNSPHFNS